MTLDTPPRRTLWTNLALGLGCAMLGAVGGWYWLAGRGPAASDRAAIEQVVHDYLIAIPEVLQSASVELDRKQAVSQLAPVRADVERAAPGVVLGNPAGRITLVEFTDYACTYCRRSNADVDALIAANPDLRVVVRELPILTPESADAAKMALAAGEQGRYAAFHKAMFAAGRPDASSIAAAASAAGLDPARANRVVAAAATEQELVRNLDLAHKLGFTGTPSWVIGDTMLTGAVGPERLAEAIDDARNRAPG